MQIMRILGLSWRLFTRDWRAGELRLFAAALVIAVGAVTEVGFFTDRVQRGMVTRSADLLGADMILVSPEPVDKAWSEAAIARGLKASEATEFSSVVLHGERLHLAGVRAVGPGYPLRGTLRTAAALFAPEVATRDVPEPGTAWAEARLMHALGLEIGDRVDVGNTRFTVTRVLTYEPGRSGNFFAIAPRLLIHYADVARTGVIQPGSRVTYGLGVAGAPSAVSDYREWLRPRLSPSQRLVDTSEGNPAIARAMERVDRYIGLTSLLAVVLAGVAIAMAARRYCARHYDMSALLRCFGSTQRDILALYLPQLALLGLAASSAGCLLGFLVQEVIHALVKSVFPMALPAPGIAPVAFGLLTGLIMLAGFALAPVLRLKSVPPLRVLRRELAPLPPSTWAAYGLAAAALLLLAWRYTQNWTLTFGVLAGVFGAIAVLGAVTWALLRVGRRLQRRVGVAWRFGLNNLWRRAGVSVGQILAFGLTFMVMAIIALVRTDLLSTWQTQLPADTPNYFAVNVLPTDVPAVERFFAGKGVRAQTLYPMVRGRLTGINGVPVTQAVTKEANNDGALQRDLNLTWSAEVPPDNRVTQGEWWSSDSDAQGVSIEERLAVRLGIKLGDTLTFTISGAQLDAKVTSVRKVQWDSFHPNFFMIFCPGTLDSFPATYITSFHLTPQQKPLLASLVRTFPSVSLIEIDQFLEQVRVTVRQATLAIELLLLFVLAAGFAVLYAALAASLDERLYEGALLRTLGASRRQLRAGHLTEFVALGVLAGLLAAVGAEVVAYVLYARVFDLPYVFKWPVWIMAPVVGGLLIGLAGYFGTRRVVDRSPVSVLREI